MTWLNSLLLGMVTGALGLLCGGLVMAGIAEWHNVSNFEGKAGFAIVGVALLGGIAGFVVGLMTARVFAAGSSPAFSPTLTIAGGIVIGAAVLVAGIAWLTGDHGSGGDETDRGPTFAERQAEEAKKERDAFDAIAANAPLETWLEYIKFGAAEERQAAVLQRIAAKPGWAAELSTLMIAQDAYIAAAALRFVELVPQPPAELVPAVAAAGKHIAQVLREVNAIPAGQDPAYLRAAEASIRFSGWMAAARVLREKCGGDFVPELRTILELSRVRTESHEMRLNVRRVASYYLHQWAGVEPLPGDPPPR